MLDRLPADLSVPAVLRDVMLPYLADLGEPWQRGTPASPGSTSPATSSAAGSRGWPVAGERARAAGPARLPARRAARYGADGFRHHAAPQRVADRLSRGGTPVGELSGPSTARILTWPSWRYPRGDPRAAPPGARRTGPAHPARPRRGRRHGADRNCDGSPADGGRPGDRGRATKAPQTLPGGNDVAVSMYSVNNHKRY